MIQLAIHEAINGRDLDYAIARATMEEMMDGTRPTSKWQPC